MFTRGPRFYFEICKVATIRLLNGLTSDFSDPLDSPMNNDLCCDLTNSSLIDDFSTVIYNLLRRQYCLQVSGEAVSVSMFVDPSLVHFFIDLRMHANMNACLFAYIHDI